MPSSHSPHKGWDAHPGIIVPPLFGERGICGFFTTRHVECDAQVISSVLSDEELKVCMPVQKHSDIVVGLDDEPAQAVGDAVVSSSRGMCIGVRVADCVPVLLYDDRTGIAAAVHAGWRGTAQEILGKTIRYMKNRHGSSPSDIMVGIGPSINQCCYEVGPEVAAAVSAAAGTDDFIIIRKGRLYAGLPEVNRLQVLAEGVRPENIWMSGECTFCSPGRFHSYRRSGLHAGRQGGFVLPGSHVFHTHRKGE